jgi:mRNA interferase MazF
MRYGMNYKQRDIVLVPIPFSDLSTNKKRPVIIISNDNYNIENEDIVVVALTSNLVYENSYCIDIDRNDVKEGKLPKKSRIRCDKIYTLSRNIVLKKFDRLKSDKFLMVQKNIKTLVSIIS